MERCDAYQLNLKISMQIAIDVAGQHMVGKAQLAGPGELAAANEAESIKGFGVHVGIHLQEAELVALLAVEVCDHIAGRAFAGLCQVVEHKTVSTGAAGHDICAQAADQLVIAGAAKDHVVRVVTGQGVVAIIAQQRELALAFEVDVFKVGQRACIQIDHRSSCRRVVVGDLERVDAFVGLFPEPVPVRLPDR